MLRSGGKQASDLIILCCGGCKRDWTTQTGLTTRGKIVLTATLGLGGLPTKLTGMCMIAGATTEAPRQPGSGNMAKPSGIGGNCCCFGMELRTAAMPGAAARPRPRCRGDKLKERAEWGGLPKSRGRHGDKPKEWTRGEQERPRLLHDRRNFSASPCLETAAASSIVMGQPNFLPHALRNWMSSGAVARPRASRGDERQRPKLPSVDIGLPGGSSQDIDEGVEADDR